MKKYISLIVPLTFYALVGITIIHFGQPAWLFSLVLAPRIDYKIVIMQGKEGGKTIIETENTFTQDKTTDIIKD